MDYDSNKNGKKPIVILNIIKPMIVPSNKLKKPLSIVEIGVVVPIPISILILIVMIFIIIILFVINTDARCKMLMMRIRI
mmetsp:Transcript_2429/g.2723  ORF Transcript_2429/g.2723 Transcript_2429/m.2723 type:complete len:80 (+) Transcript_2429:3-242(+)